MAQYKAEQDNNQINNSNKILNIKQSVLKLTGMRKTKNNEH